MGKFDFVLITLLAFLQVSFLPLNLILLLLLFLGLRKGVNYLVPRLLFAGVILGLLSGSSIGLFVVCLALTALVFLALKRLLPAANFVRLALLILALPTFEIFYRQLVFLVPK